MLMLSRSSRIYGVVRALYKPRPELPVVLVQVDNMFAPNPLESYCSALSGNVNCIGLLMVSSRLVSLRTHPLMLSYPLLIQTIRVCVPAVMAMCIVRYPRHISGVAGNHLKTILIMGSCWCRSPTFARMLMPRRKSTGNTFWIGCVCQQELSLGMALSIWL